MRSLKGQGFVKHGNVFQNISDELLYFVYLLRLNIFYTCNFVPDNGRLALICDSNSSNLLPAVILLFETLYSSIQRDFDTFQNLEWILFAPYEKGVKYGRTFEEYISKLTILLQDRLTLSGPKMDTFKSLKAISNRTLKVL